MGFAKSPHLRRPHPLPRLALLLLALHLLLSFVAATTPPIWSPKLDSLDAQIADGTVVYNLDLESQLYESIDDFDYEPEQYEPTFVDDMNESLNPAQEEDYDTIYATPMFDSVYDGQAEEVEDVSEVTSVDDEDEGTWTSTVTTNYPSNHIPDVYAGPIYPKPTTLFDRMIMGARVWLARETARHHSSALARAVRHRQRIARDLKSCLSVHDCQYGTTLRNSLQDAVSETVAGSKELFLRVPAVLRAVPSIVSILVGWTRDEWSSYRSEIDVFNSLYCGLIITKPWDADDFKNRRQRRRKIPRRKAIVLPGMQEVLRAQKDSVSVIHRRNHHRNLPLPDFQPRPIPARELALPPAWDVSQTGSEVSADRESAVALVAFTHPIPIDEPAIMTITEAYERYQPRSGISADVISELSYTGQFIVRLIEGMQSHRRAVVWLQKSIAVISLMMIVWVCIPRSGGIRTAISPIRNLLGLASIHILYPIVSALSDSLPTLSDRLPALNIIGGAIVEAIKFLSMSVTIAVSTLLRPLANLANTLGQKAPWHMQTTQPLSGAIDAEEEDECEELLFDEPAADTIGAGAAVMAANGIEPQNCRSENTNGHGIHGNANEQWGSTDNDHSTRVVDSPTSSPTSKIPSSSSPSVSAMVAGIDAMSTPSPATRGKGQRKSSAQHREERHAKAEWCNKEKAPGHPDGCTGRGCSYYHKFPRRWTGQAGDPGSPAPRVRPPSTGSLGQ